MIMMMMKKYPRGIMKTKHCGVKKKTQTAVPNIFPTVVHTNNKNAPSPCRPTLFSRRRPRPGLRLKWFRAFWAFRRPWPPCSPISRAPPPCKVGGGDKKGRGWEKLTSAHIEGIRHPKQKKTLYRKHRVTLHHECARTTASFEQKGIRKQATKQPTNHTGDDIYYRATTTMWYSRWHSNMHPLGPPEHESKPGCFCHSLLGPFRGPFGDLHF